jgi:hypothetical protein
MRVLDPTFDEAARTATRPERLATLEGRTVGLLDNGKIRVYELLNHIEEILRTQYGVMHVVRFKKPDASRPAPAELIADMQQCDAVISAVGD